MTGKFLETYYFFVMASRLILGCWMVFLCFACNSTENVTPLTPTKPYVLGKNRFTVKVDADDREYYTHIPKGYDGKTAFPVVIMCHGTGGDGEKFYNISGWKELGETQNILTIFPSSWEYCVTEVGIKKTTTKWNIYPSTFTYCPGETPRDDIKFMRIMMEDLKQKYNVDAKRIYFVGFSNGGEFTSRCAVELSDLLAACVANAGPLPPNANYTPKRLLPVMLQFGNSDELIKLAIGAKSDFPMDFNQLFSTYPAIQQLVNSYLNSFKVKTTYTAKGDANNYIWADYPSIAGNTDNWFRLVLVKGLDHNYPNGINHPLKGAELHWGWIKDYKLP